MMIDVKPMAKGLAVLVVAALVLLPATVSAQGIPEEYTNLKILPEGIQRSELVGIMRGQPSNVRSRLQTSESNGLRRAVA